MKSLVNSGQAGLVAGLCPCLRTNGSSKKSPSCSPELPGCLTSSEAAQLVLALKCEKQIKFSKESSGSCIAFLEHEETHPVLCTECQNFPTPYQPPDPWPPLRIVAKAAAGLVGCPSLQLS